MYSGTLLQCPIYCRAAIINSGAPKFLVFAHIACDKLRTARGCTNGVRYFVRGWLSIWFPFFPISGFQTVFHSVQVQRDPTHTILFESITFKIQTQLNHVTVIAENSREFLREITSCNCILLKNKETVTVMIINSEDPESCNCNPLKNLQK